MHTQTPRLKAANPIVPSFMQTPTAQFPQGMFPPPPVVQQQPKGSGQAAPVQAPKPSVASQATGSQTQTPGKGYGNTPTNPQATTQGGRPRTAGTKKANAYCPPGMSMPTTSPRSMTMPASLGMKLPSLMNPGAIPTNAPKMASKKVAGCGTKRSMSKLIRQNQKGKRYKKADVGNALGGAVGSGISSGVLGSILGAPLGMAAGAARGNVPEGLGRGVIRGGMTGAGVGAGSALGAYLGQQVGGGEEGKPLSTLLGALAGAGAGGYAGWRSSGNMLGKPKSVPDKAKPKSEEQEEKQGQAPVPAIRSQGIFGPAGSAIRSRGIFAQAPQAQAPMSRDAQKQKLMMMHNNAFGAAPGATPPQAPPQMPSAPAQATIMSPQARAQKEKLMTMYSGGMPRPTPPTLP